MRRGAPRWFTQGKARERFHRWWPWVLSSTCATLYFFNHEPFDEAAGTFVTAVRRPLLRTIEWIELHDIDPETMALELPPDMIFGPLEFKQQMRFLIAALRADNELADGYLARVIVDHMDLSLDPPILPEDDFLAAGGRELLQFAIEDFTGTGSRTTRRHIFFQPDQFLQLINFIAPYPTLTETFVREQHGVDLVLRALRHSSEPYARVLAMRALTLFAFTQKEDGSVERAILQANGMHTVVNAYRRSTGDPTDTRFMTLLLSSILRHYPVEGGREFIEAEGVESIVDNLNVARYKGVPQHLRLLHDTQKLPRAAIGGSTVDARIEDANFLGVAMGLLETYPEFYEVVGDLLKLITQLVPSQASPFNLLEYRAMPILCKLYVRWQDDGSFRTDGTRTLLVRLFELMLKDKTCQRCFDPSVASYELQECLVTARTAIEQERGKAKSATAVGPSQPTTTAPVPVSSDTAADTTASAATAPA